VTRIVSLGNKVKQLEGLLDTPDLTEWENNFLHGISVRTDCGRNTLSLTEKQVEVIDRLWGKHFA
jgi:hypothetical protein